MPKFLNTNHHRAYVRHPDEVGEDGSDLVRIEPFEEVEASGVYADVLLGTPGFAKVGTKEAKEAQKEWDERNESLDNFGPKAFPVPEDERTAERSGLHITGRDSGIPVAGEAEAEVGDVKDATGADPYEGVAAVERGEVTRGDVPKGVADDQNEPQTESESTSEKSESVAPERESGTVTTSDAPTTSPKRRSSRKKKS